MYNHIQGKLVEKNPTHVVIDCGGVGYLLNISLHTYSKIPEQENCKLLVHLSVKEDSLALFGFADEDERRLFRQLISVSGIGETTARMMLSSLSPPEIQNAIISGNSSVLQGIKGIGAKTAARAIIDLRDKMGKGESTSIPGGSWTSPNNKIRAQALSALLTLGFGKPAVEKVLDKVMQNQGENVSVEQIIKLALNHL